MRGVLFSTLQFLKQSIVRQANPSCAAGVRQQPPGQRGWHVPVPRAPPGFVRLERFWVLAAHLLSFPVVPDSETELSAQLMNARYVPSCEVDLSSSEALAQVHCVLLEALRSYWAPCYVMHVLSTQPFSTLEVTRASRISALAMGHSHLATRDQLHPEDIGVIVQKLPSIEKTQGRDSQTQGDTSEEDRTETCVVEELLDIEHYCDFPEQENKRHEEEKGGKVSEELEDEDDSKVRLNMMRLALKEMALKPEPMLYLNQLLRHYLFGYRHLDQEKPVTDRRTLCLLACDDLAGSPFRSYLRGQAQQLYLSYFDFWSAMRRYQQLHDLNRMGEIMDTKYFCMIADAHTQHIRYMVNRFLMGSGIDASILEYKIRLSLLEDIRKARWSPLINSTLDVVSNMDSSSPLLNLEQDSQAEDIMSSGLPMQIPSVLHSLLKRRNEAASLRTFADRRCLSDPWREDPKHDPDGDMECLRPTDPRGTKYNGVVGVLGEQHRLLAFQFLIVLREDLPDAQVCDVASLARIVGSDYGSLHIPFSAPVTHTDEMQFNVFKKYLELKGQLKAVAFVEDVQDALRLLDQTEQETMVAGIIEQYFGNGERILTFGEELPMTVRIDKSLNLKNLHSVQLSLEKQIEKTWFKKYVEDLQLQKVDLSLFDQETNKDDWLENFLLKQESKKQKGKVEKERANVQKEKREKHTESKVVDEGKQSRETIKDLERKEENEESKESKKKKEKKEIKEKEEKKEGKKKKEKKEGKEKKERKERSDTLGDLEEGKYKTRKESSGERKTKPQAKNEKNKDQEEENEIKSVSGTESEEEQNPEATKVETLHKNKEVFKDYEQEKIQKKKGGEDDKRTSIGTSSLNQMTSKRQAKILKKEIETEEEEEEDEIKEVEEEEEQEEVKEKLKKKGEDDEGTSLGTTSLNQMMSKRQAEISKKEETTREEIKEKKQKDFKTKKSMQKVADEKNLAEIKSQTPTDAQTHKFTSRILQPHTYSSPAVIKEEIQEIEEETEGYQTETEFLPEKEQLENMEYSVESIKEEIRKGKEEKRGYQAECLIEQVKQESTESSPAVHARSKVLTVKAKLFESLRPVIKKMAKFTRSLNTPLERKLFEIYLKQELQNAKDHLTSDSPEANGISNRFKNQMISHVNCSAKIGVKVEKENPILGMRAEAIIECFFQSVCEPVVQVNLCPEKTVSQIIKSKSMSLSADMFHDTCIRLYPLLFKMWKIFAHQWLSRLGGNRQKNRIEMILASFKDPIIGDCPHPEEPTADYLHLALSDYKYSPLGDKDDQDCVVAIEERGRKHQTNPEPKQKGETYSAPKVCSEPKVMTSEQMGGEKVVEEEEENVTIEESGQKHKLKAKELQLLSLNFPSRSLPKLDGCLQLQDSQSVWGPGKRPFKGDYAVQVSRMITLLCESR
ncbi:hypothetical protein C0Q70_18671 [Pomacea canaliculata]|uniref:RGS domain-containing protein n=1 Tax=Pomacea canaliculata TaxID=400727 RepID=A0A2T7NH88_POMCA|nr:hypothetical protein C0Q70_18671 [Pomacea canaliculata]